MDIADLRREAEAYNKRKAQEAEVGQGLIKPPATYKQLSEMYMGLAVKSFESFLLFKALSALRPTLKWNAMACAVLAKGCLLEIEQIAAVQEERHKKLIKYQVDFEGDC